MLLPCTNLLCDVSCSISMSAYSNFSSVEKFLKWFFLSWETPGWEHVYNTKMLLVGRAVQLLLQYCQQDVFVKSSYVCIWDLITLKISYIYIYIYIWNVCVLQLFTLTPFWQYSSSNWTTVPAISFFLGSKRLHMQGFPGKWKIIL